jgi:phosphoesterase RecJ-like protein
MSFLPNLSKREKIRRVGIVSSNAARARELLREANAIAILTHQRADGDAIASMLALGLCLSRGGCSVFCYLPEGIPKRFQFLPGAELVLRTVHSAADLFIALDCADRKRLALPNAADVAQIDINIDHHSTNTRFGKMNWVDPNAVSTTELLYRFMCELELPVDAEVATNLLTGLVTDTIGFRTENVGPDVLRLAAKWQEMGAPLASIIERSLNQRTYVAVRYWGCGLSRMMQEDGIVWTTLQQADRDSVGYNGLDDADLVNLLSTIDGAKIAIILVEQPDNEVKVSWRSRCGIDVARLAEQFGGGGHEAAAGAMIKGDLDDVVSAVLTATRAIDDHSTEAER